MKTKLTQFIPSVLVLFVIGFSYFSLWCTAIGRVCYRTFLDSMFLSVINPLYFFALYSIPLAVILIFIPRHTFNSWLKFAAWALPLSFLLISGTDVTSHRMGIDFFPFYRDDAARLVGVVFSIGSLIATIPKLVLSSSYLRRNPLSAPEDEKSYLQSWYMVLAAFGGLACLIAIYVLSVVPASMFIRGELEIAIILFAAVLLFSVYALWHMLRIVRDYTGVADRALWHVCVIGSVGLVSSIALIVFSMPIRDMSLLYGAGVFAAIDLLALLVYAVIGLIKKLRGVSGASWKVIATSFVLSATTAVLLWGIIFLVMMS